MTEPTSSDPNKLVPLGRDHVIVEVDTGKRSPGSRRLRGRKLVSTSQASPARGSGTFKIDFKYLSMDSLSQAEQNEAINSFQYAAHRLGKMIMSKLPIVYPDTGLRCGAVQQEQLPSPLEDLFIYVNIKYIDGSGGVLGQAGPCVIANGFPRVGYVEFDSADVSRMLSDQTFDAVCVHEMSHILGFGTLWDNKKLVGGTTSDPRYTGSYGTAALATIKASQFGTPPVQDSGGAGTARSHWRDRNFGNEMMTAYLDTAYQPLSALSVESFRDLGYTVDSSVADSFNTSANGYNTPNVPIGGESPVAPVWFDFDSASFWNSTTVWIFGCIGAALIVLFLSCVANRLKARREAKARKRLPSAMSSRHGEVLNGGQANAIPTAYAIPQAGYVPTAVPTAGFGNPRRTYGESEPTYYSAAADVNIADEAKVRTFMEVTSCNDVSMALAYLHEANNNLYLAIGRYVENPSNQVSTS